MINKILDGSEVYIVARLTNDMEVMAIFESEDSKYVKLSHCMEVRMVPTVGEDGKRSYSKFAAMPLTQFSDDPNFIIDKQHILFIKKLSKDMIEHYRSIISAPADVEDYDGDWDELDWEEEEDILENATEELMKSSKKSTIH